MEKKNFKEIVEKVLEYFDDNRVTTCSCVLHSKSDRTISLNFDNQTSLEIKYYRNNNEKDKEIIFEVEFKGCFVKSFFDDRDSFKTCATIYWDITSVIDELEKRIEDFNSKLLHGQVLSLYPEDRERKEILGNLKKIERYFRDGSVKEALFDDIEYSIILDDFREIRLFISEDYEEITLTFMVKIPNGHNYQSTFSGEPYKDEIKHLENLIRRFNNQAIKRELGGN